MSKKGKITEKQVEHVSMLASLELDKRQLKKFQSQLSQVIEYVERLSEVDTKRVKPTSQITGLENVFREDESAPSLTQEQVLSGAKREYKGFFKVEAIFDET